LHFNHNLGSCEAFQRLNDIRPFRPKQWLKKAQPPIEQVTSLIGNEVRPWIQGFARRFGEETSKCILAEVGNPYNASSDACQHYNDLRHFQALDTFDETLAGTDHKEAGTTYVAFFTDMRNKQLP
jgi:hypothetical protein